MKYKWSYLPVADKNIILELATKLKVDPVIANLFINRGITSFSEAEKFFNPRFANLYDPFLMNDMDKAVDRAKYAFEHGEKIMILGDYDVDGTTGTALLFNVLTSFYDNVIYYIPDRYSEGYGVSFKGIDFAAQNQVKLIISVDCGIKANEKVEYAQKLGIDFIILDHHTPGAELPPAVAVLDPKRSDNTYPFNELTGCGVAFKFLQALHKKGFFDQKKLIQNLDLLALSIAADIVPILDENRILAYYGLKILNNSPSLGIRALKQVSGYKDKPLTIGQLVFSMAPRINAAGRIEHGSYAVELMTSKKWDKALEIAKKIDALNRQRQNIQNNIVKQILDIYSASPQLQKKSSTVLYNPDWHKGVVGIVASKIIESYYKPTIILTKSGEKITGSARSVADFDLYTAIENCREWLDHFGGHKFAAGLTLSPENLDKFIDCFEATVAKTITAEQKIPVLKIAGTLKFSQITPRLIKILQRLEPYGPGNPKPVFVTKNVRDTGYSRTIGKKQEHLLLQLEDSTGIILKATGFNMAHLFEKIRTGQRFDIAFTVDQEQFNGRTSIELDIKDIEFK